MAKVKGLFGDQYGKGFEDRLEKFNAIINAAPDKTKIRSERDEDTNEVYDFLPISVVENDLRDIYSGLVQKELISYSRDEKKEIVGARIKVFHPVFNEWLNYDGIGVAVFNTTKTEPIEIYREEKLNPFAAYSEALKNAAKKIGPCFGSELNRQTDDSIKKASKGAKLN